MKTIKTFIVLFMALVAMNSCTGPMGPPGEPGDDASGVAWDVIFLEAPNGDWQRNVDQDGNFLSYSISFDVPEIDDFVFDEALVVCYALEGDKQRDLPMTRPYLAEAEDGSLVPYFEEIDYDYGIGEVTIYSTISDYYDMGAPEGLNFRLVIIQ